MVNSNQFQFSYGNWTVGSPTAASGFPVFYKTQAQGSPQIFTPDVVDPINGIVTVNTFNVGDDVTGSYEFSYFTDQELTYFLLQAVSKLNNIPPLSRYSLDDPVQGTSANYDYDLEYFLVDWAYKLALEALLCDLMTWRAKFIWSDPIALAGIVQSTVDRIENQISSTYLNIKGRRGLVPHGISIGRTSVPSQVSDQSYAQYSIATAGH